MTIEIEEGKLDQIVVHENESAMFLSRKFCQKHGLAKKLQGALAARIERNIDDVISQEEAPQFEVEDAKLYEPPRNSGPDHRSYIEEYSKVMLEQKNQPSIERNHTQSTASYKPLTRATTVTPGSYRPRARSPTRAKSPSRAKSPV